MIIQRLLKSVNKEYKGLLASVQSIIYDVDSYGKFDSTQSSLQREDENNVKTNFEVPTNLLNYINTKVETNFIYPGWDEEDEILDYLLDKTIFTTQKFQATIYTSNEGKNKVWRAMLNYFYKLNTRGKSFTQEELKELEIQIKHLKNKY